MKEDKRELYHFYENDDYAFTQEIFINKKSSGEIETIYRSKDGYFGEDLEEEFVRKNNINQLMSVHYNIHNFALNIEDNRNFGFIAPIKNHMTLYDLERLYLLSDDNHNREDYEIAFREFMLDLFKN